MDQLASETLRLPVSRHLQDFNGYCGPACALMVVEFAGSTKSPPVFAQNELFKEVRAHAKATKDRRPVKSPAESLLSMLNDHTAGDAEWVKTFHPETEIVAAEIVQALEGKKQPCLMLVSKGMHWVVAFGLQRKDDGSPAGVLMRDPAWAGMPKFYGLSIFPEKPAIEHTQSPCPCLDHTDNPPGTVHERFITMHELISGRGLQGSPDWEGKGAIALVPDGVSSAAIVPLAISAPSAAAVANPKENAGQAALDAIRENGLFGRPDSPADWDAALQGATAGEPILVKDPDDSRDDFYLVPLIPANISAKHGAWAMLDAKTLALREVSLLESWKDLAFPDENSGDAEKASQQEHTLPDGTVARFKKEDFKPNTKNLVWASSAASVLPYWPVKELIAPHPVTAEPVSIYVNQEGEVFSQLTPDNLETLHENPSESSHPRSGKSNIGKAVAAGLGLGVVAAVAYYFVHQLDVPPGLPGPASPSKSSQVVTDTAEDTAPEVYPEAALAVIGEEEEAAEEVQASRFVYSPSFHAAQFSGADTDLSPQGGMPDAYERSQHRLRKSSYTFWDAEYFYRVVHKVLPQFRMRGTINKVDLSSIKWQRTDDISSLVNPSVKRLEDVGEKSFRQILKTKPFSHKLSVVRGTSKKGKAVRELSVNARAGGIYILRTRISNFPKY